MEFLGSELSKLVVPQFPNYNLLAFSRRKNWYFIFLGAPVADSGDLT